TPDLRNAIATLSQLSYGPEPFGRPGRPAACGGRLYESRRAVARPDARLRRNGEWRRGPVPGRIRSDPLSGEGSGSRRGQLGSASSPDGMEAGWRRSGLELQPHRADQPRAIGGVDPPVGVVIAQVERHRAQRPPGQTGIPGVIVRAPCALTAAGRGAKGDRLRNAPGRARLDKQRAAGAAEIVRAPGDADPRRQRADRAGDAGARLERSAGARAMWIERELGGGGRFEAESGQPALPAEIGGELSLPVGAGDILGARADQRRAERELTANEPLRTVGLAKALGHALAGELDLERWIGWRRRRERIEHSRHVGGNCDALMAPPAARRPFAYSAAIRACSARLVSAAMWPAKARAPVSVSASQVRWRPARAALRAFT